MRKHFDISIFGRVQGVDFRTTAKMEADRLGVVGLARNEADGSVYIEAEGEEAALREFVDWCKTGTPWSEVERVEVSVGELKNYTDFKIRSKF